jgi:hypothetical protein
MLQFSSFQQALEYIHQLPYGRNTDRADYRLVLTEGKGTCSTKHAFLKALAKEMEEASVQLFLGMYKMSEENTPGVGKVLDRAGIPYIPEAHCYLKINGKRVDVTSLQADIIKVEKVLMEEQEISPEDIGFYKLNYHKNFIKKWIQKENSNLTFEAVWSIREACIAALSK